MLRATGLWATGLWATASSRSTRHSIILETISGVAYTRSIQLDDPPSSRVIVPLGRHRSSPLSWMSVIRCIASVSGFVRCSPAHISWCRLKSPRMTCSVSVLSWWALFSSGSVPSSYCA